MKRRAAHQLTAWKAQDRRKPLMLRGARQVGKTWLAQTWGREHFEHVAYVNCERTPSLEQLFAGEIDPQRIAQGLGIAARAVIEPGRTLVIIDEIQAIPRAVTALKYFAEELPQLHVVAAGSLLGVALGAEAFPVGKVEFVDLHPMDFVEFLEGLGESELGAVLENRAWEIAAPFHDRLVELLRTYLYVGGMPEAVLALRDSGDVRESRVVHEQLLGGYELDIAKHAGTALVPRITQLWSSIPAQLAREPRKFVWGIVRSGARARAYEDALDWLSRAGLVHRVHRYSKPAHPIRAYEDPAAFKVFLHDVGLLGALSGLDASAVIRGEHVFEEFKGALTEQYVLQQLVARTDATPMYWSAERGTAEVDLAFEHRGELVPVEVKAAENLRAKSLRSYVERYGVRDAIRTSLAPYREQGWMTNVPLYGIGSYVSTARSR